jgi:prepilin-type processing-associated H-X9-DG protein
MIKRTGFTKTDLAVALACAVFVFVNAQVIIAGGRERSKREVCMANLRALTAAWDIYADDNKGKIPCGDVYYSWSFPSNAGGPQLAWREWPHPWPHVMPPNTATNQIAAYPYSSVIPEAAWQHATAEGLLWKYVKDYDIYKCYNSDKGSFVTYSMSQSMNTWPNAGGTTQNPAPIFTNRNQIQKPAERFVFLDTGYAKQGAFFIKYSGTNPARWYDSPPMRHNKGTTFSFADGHTIYRKWTDPHTLASTPEMCAWGGCSDDTCDCDLRWMVKATWGDVPYDCTNPAKHCED